MLLRPHESIRYTGSTGTGLAREGEKKAASSIQIYSQQTSACRTSDAGIPAPTDSAICGLEATYVLCATEMREGTSEAAVGPLESVESQNRRRRRLRPGRYGGGSTSPRQVCHCRLKVPAVHVDGRLALAPNLARHFPMNGRLRECPCACQNAIGTVAFPDRQAL